MAGLGLVRGVARIQTPKEDRFGPREPLAAVGGAASAGVEGEPGRPGRGRAARVQWGLASEGQGGRGGAKVGEGQGSFMPAWRP